MKTVKAVEPYIYPDGINFKHLPYEAWKCLGGKIASAHYPIRLLHGLFFRYELPSFFKCKDEARLRFVEPVSITFDTFPDYAHYEIIPFVWDCWPCYFDKMCKWLKKHKVRTSIFTSSQTAEKIQTAFPDMNVLWCPEAVDTSIYQAGQPLSERKVDLLEFGRQSHIIIDGCRKFNYVCTKENVKFLYTNEQLYEIMGDAKITIALPRCMTQPEVAGDIETLTQRYWENMLSRIVMVGHAPKELTDLIGYNPVIELDREHANEQILDILSHINDYQPLVDKNRETALKMGSWDIRMKKVMEWLFGVGYEV